MKRESPQLLLFPLLLEFRNEKLFANLAFVVSTRYRCSVSVCENVCEKDSLSDNRGAGNVIDLFIISSFCLTFYLYAARCHHHSRSPSTKSKSKWTQRKCLELMHAHARSCYCRLIKFNFRILYPYLNCVCLLTPTHLIRNSNQEHFKCATE